MIVACKGASSVGKGSRGKGEGWARARHIGDSGSTDACVTNPGSPLLTKADLMTSRASST
jgi:hypothetical protein